MSKIEKFISMSVKTALVGIILVLLAGLYTRELTKQLAQQVSAEQFELATHYLQLLHGHFLMLFGIIPTMMGVFGFMAKEYFTKNEKKARKLILFMSIYHLGAFLSISLLFYKATFHVITFKALGSLDAADKALFGGSEVLRAILYGLSHTIMAVALVGLIIYIWGAYSSKKVKAS
jgi:hypothetical protein